MISCNKLCSQKKRRKNPGARLNYLRCGLFTSAAVTTTAALGIFTTPAYLAPIGSTVATPIAVTAATAAARTPFRPTLASLTTGDGTVALADSLLQCLHAFLTLFFCYLAGFHRITNLLAGCRDTLTAWVAFTGPVAFTAGLFP